MKGVFGAWVLALSLTMGAVAAAEVEHRQGEFRFFVGPVPAFVVPRSVAAQWDPNAPGAEDSVWRYWLYDEQVDRRKGLDAVTIDYAYEARTSSHLGEAGKFKIEFNPEYQRLVLHEVELRRTGKWEDRLLPKKISLARRESDFEKDMADGRVTALIVLDDVRIGDVVRIRYTITGSNPILGGHAWDSLSTAWHQPIHDAHLRVLYDPGTQVRTHLRNGAKAPVVRTGADAVEVRVDVHGAPAIVDEGNYPVWYSPTPRVHFGPARSWGDVVAWAEPLYPATSELPSDLQARIAQWNRLPDAPARLRAALRAVQDEVRYFGVEMGSSTHRPNVPADTWRRRFGDCKDKTYLLVTILRELDISAVPALVSTTRGRALLDVEPTAAAFDHVIVRATLGREMVYVDPTMTQQGGDPRKLDLSQYGVALPVASGASALDAITAPKVQTDAIATVERFTPSGADGQLRLEIETTYRGASADYARRDVATSRNDERQRRYAEYYRKRFGELDVVKAPVVQDDREANTLKIAEAYLLKTPFESEGSQVRGLDVFAEALDGASRLPGQIARTGPLNAGRVAEYGHEIILDAPPGWRSTASNEKDAFASPAFDYSRSVDRKGDEVRVAYSLKVKSRDVEAPALAIHLSELRKVRDNLSARLRFQPPATAIDASERERRLKQLLRGALDGADATTQ